MNFKFWDMLLFGDLPEKISKACKSLELKLGIAKKLLYYKYAYQC